MDVRQQRLPVGLELVSHAKDLVDLNGVALAGDIDPGVAHAAHHCDLLGRELEEGGATLVVRRGQALCPAQLLVAEADTGDDIVVEDLGHALAQDVDRGHQRDRTKLLPVPLQQLRQRARVISDLGDGHVRAGADLQPQLEVLRHEIRLGGLEGVDGTADGEAGTVLAGITEHGDEPDRVDVEDRPRAAGEALLGVVAAQGQDAGQTGAGEAIDRGLERGPAAIAAGEVDHALAAHLFDVLRQRLGAQADEAARVVSHGQGGDALVSDQPTRGLALALTGLILQRAGPRHELDERGAAVVACQRRGEVTHQRYSSTASYMASMLRAGTSGSML